MLHEEEDELELPPLDGSLDERTVPLAGTEDELAEDDAAAAAGDDEGAADLDPGATLDAVEERSANDTEAAEDAVDVGSLADAVALPERDAATSDERGLDSDEDEASPFDGASGGDTGAGTGEDPASFIDESALPPLDADEDASQVPEAAVEELTFLAAPWDRARWRAASGMGAQVPCWRVAVSPSIVVAAGPTVIVARGGARVSPCAGLDIEASAVAASDGVILAAARRGAMFVSADAGDTWTAGGVPWPPFRGALEIVATPGRFWICESGALWSLRWGPHGRAEPPLLVRRDGVRAMAVAGSALVILAEHGADLVIERLRGDDEAALSEQVPAHVRAAIGDAAPPLAAEAGGRLIALLAGGAVHLSRDAGRTFRASPSPAAVAVAFAGAGDIARAMVLCASSERGRDASLYIDEATPAGSFLRVAELPCAPGRAALAWDAARDVLWVACPAGLVAFERAAKH